MTHLDDGFLSLDAGLDGSPGEFYVQVPSLQVGGHGEFDTDGFDFILLDSVWKGGLLLVLLPARSLLFVGLGLAKPCQRRHSVYNSAKRKLVGAYLLMLAVSWLYTVNMELRFERKTEECRQPTRTPPYEQQQELRGTGGAKRVVGVLGGT